MKFRAIDETRLNDPRRRLAVSATNLQSGEVEYFEKGKCDLYRAIQASATVPFVSAPVVINGIPYLDGGCAEKIPYEWAKQSGEDKIIVVRTRELSYRRTPGSSKLARKLYGKYPAFVKSMDATNENFNRTVEELEADSENGRIFLVAPSEPVTVKRFDGDMEKLGELYWLGYHDMGANIDKLRAYL